MTKRICYRVGVSLKLTLEHMEHFRRLLHMHYEQYDTLPNSIVKRFNFLTEQMFTTFIANDTTEKVKKYEDIEWFPLDDNLDTGNASTPAFPPFAKTFLSLACKLETYRLYYGPQPIDGLEEALKLFLVRLGILDTAAMHDLGIVVGAGTVHLYDLVCRRLIKRNEDTILLPSITYGFFMPQVERAGGKAVFIPTDGTQNKKVTAGQIRECILSHNRTLLLHWLEGLEAQLYLYTLKLQQKGIVEERRGEDIDIRKIREFATEVWQPCEVDAFVSKILQENLFSGDEEKFRLASETPQLELPLPPRVVGLLHINPNIYGSAYSADENLSLANVLTDHKVALIEDLAYNLLWLGEELRITSALPYVTEGYTLVGFSKPFALANIRVGLLLTTRALARELERYVENSIGFVSSMSQKALISLLTTPEPVISSYLKNTNLAAPNSYSHRCRLMLACLEGVNSAKLNTEERTWCRGVLNRELRRFFEWKESLGIYLLDREFLRRKGRDIEDGSDAVLYQHYRKILAEAFLEEGLRKWFKVCIRPEAGFFIIVDCSGLIDASPIAGIPIRNSFDAFALLAYFLGVRTLPEETMTVMENKEQCGKLLRLSISCSSETIVRALFTVYIGLQQLIELNTHSSLEGRK